MTEEQFRDGLIRIARCSDYEKKEEVLPLLKKHISHLIKPAILQKNHGNGMKIYKLELPRNISANWKSTVIYLKFGVENYMKKQKRMIWAAFVL